MKEKITGFIETRLGWSNTPELASLFAHQSFGVVQFLAELTWQDDPEFEKWLVNEWNENWSKKFQKIELGG